MRIKTLRRWLIALAVFIAIALGGLLSLNFILTLDEINEYPIVSRFWYGVREGCLFATIGLSFIWLFVFLFAIIEAIVGEEYFIDSYIYDEDDEGEDEIQPKPQKPKRVKPKKGKNNYVIDLTDKSHAFDGLDEW